MRLTLIILIATGLRLMAQSSGELMDLSVRLLEEGNYRLSEENLRLFISRYPYREYDLGDAYYRLGQLAMYQGQLDSARYYNERSMELRLQLAAEELGKNYLLEGQLQWLRANPVASLAALERAAEFPFIDDPLLPAEIQRVMGGSYLQAGRPDLARARTEQAQLIIEVLEGPDAPVQFSLLLQKAQIAALRGQAGEPESYLKAALALASNPQQKAIVLQELAEEALRLKDWKSAVAYADQGLAEDWDRRATEPAGLQLKAAEALLLQGSPEAEGRIQAAMTQLFPSFRPRHFSDNPPERPVSDSSLLIRAFELKALALLATYQEGTEDSLLQQALYCADRGLQTMEAYLARSGPQRLRALSLQPYESLYGLAIAASLLLAEESGNTNYRMRALRLLDRAHRFSEYQAWQQEYADLSGPDIYYQGLQSKMGPEEAILALYEDKAILVSIALSQDELRAKLHLKRYPRLEKAVQEGGAPLLHAYLRPAGELGLSEHQQEVRQMYKAVEKDQAKPFSKAAWSISERLLQPLSAAIRQKQTLMVSAFGAAQSLPLEWLLTEKPVRWWVKWHRLRYLGGEVTPRYTLRPGAWPEEPAGRGSGGKWLGVLPGFQSDSAYATVTGTIAREAELFGYQAISEGRGIRPQPTLASQLMEYSDGLGADFEARVLTGASASESAVQQATTEARWLHFNAPVFEHPLIRSLSGFLLAQSGTRAAADGWLRFSEIKDWPLGAEAAVLENVPAGLQPLAVQALGATGVQQLLFVHEELSPERWQSFYSEASKTDWAGALLRLRKARQADRRTASPQFWSAFRLYQAPR